VGALRERAKANVAKAFRPGRLVDRAPPMLMPEGVQIETSPLPSHIEAEIGIEGGRDVEIGNREDEAMQRMHRHGAFAARRGPGCCVHSSSFAPVAATPAAGGSRRRP